MYGDKARVEIERKFLIKDDSWRAGIGDSTEVRQGFLSFDEHATVRVRRVLDIGVITVKGKTQGISRSEFEYQIPKQDADEMLDTLCRGVVIDKTRHRIFVGDLVWEVDEFHGANQGLILAEIELASEDQEFDRPSWLGKEVSYDIKYFNSYLARHPFSSWSAE